MNGFEVGSVIGGLRIDGVAGRGGMGVVYRAHHIALNRTVAMKVVNPDLAGNPEFRERFRREARLAAALEHPHVVPILHAGEDDGFLYLTMRFVDGTDLAAMIREHGRVAPGDAAEIVAQVAGALDAAHARGMVHRDVKPANILVTRPSGGWHAYLTDFGITKEVQGTSMTQGGLVVGSLDYISPEQLDGADLDGRADVYSLGCVLFQMLTGDVPYPRPTTAARMYAHMHAPVPRPGEAVPELSGPLDDVLARALAKDPEDRFGSAGEFAKAAVAAAAGTEFTWQPAFSEQVAAAVDPQPSYPSVPPVHSPTDPTAQHWTAPPTQVDLPRPRARRRWWVGGAGAAAVALVVAGVVVLPRVLDTTEPAPPPPATTTEPPKPVAPAGQVTGTPITVGTGAVQFAAGGGFLWTAHPYAGTISKVDAAARTSTEVPVGGQPNQLAVGGGKVWVWNYSSAFTPVDIATGRNAGLIRTELDIAWIAAGGGAIWFTVPDKDLVGRLDMATGKWTGETVKVGRRPGAISVDGDKVYVVNDLDGTLTTIDAITRQPVGAARKLPDGVREVEAVAGRLYVAGRPGMALVGAGDVTTDQLVPLDGVSNFAATTSAVWISDTGRNELVQARPRPALAVGRPDHGCRRAHAVPAGDRGHPVGPQQREQQPGRGRPRPALKNDRGILIGCPCSTSAPSSAASASTASPVRVAWVSSTGPTSWRSTAPSR